MSDTQCKPLPDQKSERTTSSFIVGANCPFCGQGILDYDGTLTLVCPACGKAESGSFT